MAWQTPKTNWGAADGVRDTDFNRIEGNILELRNTESLKETLLVYVSTTGNDTTGAGTATAPFRTITKALSVIPPNLGGKNASVTISAGTYSEAVTIRGFSGGSVTLTGVTNAAVTVTSLTVNGCVCNITSLKVTTTAATGVTVANGGSLIATGEIVCSGSGSGIRVMGCSRLHLAGTATITNANNAIEVTNCSAAYVGTLTGSNVTTGVYASAGSILAYGVLSIAVTGAAVQTTNGGRVFTGAQGNALIA